MKPLVVGWAGDHPGATIRPDLGDGYCRCTPACGSALFGFGPGLEGLHGPTEFAKAHAIQAPEQPPEPEQDPPVQQASTPTAACVAIYALRPGEGNQGSVYWLLMVARKDGTGYGLPGGKVESSDRDARSTALREAREETGLAPPGVQPIHAGAVGSHVVACYAGRVSIPDRCIRPTPVTSPEGLSTRWVRPWQLVEASAPDLRGYNAAIADYFLALEAESDRRAKAEWRQYYPAGAGEPMGSGGSFYLRPWNEPIDRM